MKNRVYDVRFGYNQGDSKEYRSKVLGLMRFKGNEGNIRGSKGVSGDLRRSKGIQRYMKPSKQSRTDAYVSILSHASCIRPLALSVSLYRKYRWIRLA